MRAELDAGGGIAVPPPRVQPLLALQGLGKRFGALQALQDASLEIMPGEIHCLLGENGAGKSTLCNLVFGVHSPDAGRMLLDGAPYAPRSPADALAHGIAMVHQHFSLVPDLSVVDNLLLGQARGRLDRKAGAARLAQMQERYGLALDPHARIQDLSVGERQRVEIVKCLVREPRLVVLDEPTAVLLPEEIEALLAVCRRVAAGGCGVVLVTHKLAEIREVAQRATVLRAGKVVARSEAPADEIDLLVRAMIQRDLARPGTGAGGAAGEVAAANAAPASAAPGTAATAQAGPALSADPTPPRAAAHDFHTEPGMPVPEAALMADGLTVRDADGVLRLDKFTLLVAPGEIVAVAGVEGNGQSELGAVLSGMLRPTEGRFFVCGEEMTGRAPAALTAAGCGVVPEDRHALGCVTAMSLAENILLDRLQKFRRWGLLDRAALGQVARELMARFDVRAASPYVAFGGLSGGNQQKAVLARELTLDPLRFLLASQPTRGLDVGAVEAVYGHIRAAAARGVGVLLISSELDELLAVADRVVVLYRGRVMGSCRAEPAARARIGAWMAGHAQDEPSPEEEHA
ncbi:MULTISPECIES: ABC transporter ATP-binding protein [Ramlibacter]|uniref:ABC transporter ATP-binding protein n=1 Tax=Ramlibacter aquaticus TaxID=2780094 RepID=A0ABR9SIC9_9BURK|nr:MULTISPECIES: ABC transporter ATP-binding protein [Ramlibacter]MBE7942035.1 ABC transporter ATP-binding protein [Ramlibacter aquaticus]